MQRRGEESRGQSTTTSPTTKHVYIISTVTAGRYLRFVTPVKQAVSMLTVSEQDLNHSPRLDLEITAARAGERVCQESY